MKIRSWISDNIFVFLVAVLSVILAVVAIGAIRNDIAEKIAYKESEKPEITEYGFKSNRKYFYLVDEGTGVVYIGFTGVRSGDVIGGMTVAFNSDGTVMTKEDIN